MPEIYIYALEGHSIEEKKGLVRDVTDAIVKNFRAKPEKVIIQLVEAPKHNKASGGILLSELLSGR